MKSSDPFTRCGANDDFHMNMIRGLCLGDRKSWPWYGPDPDWDKEYMKAGGENWLQIAPHWFPCSVTGKVLKGAKKDLAKRKGTVDSNTIRFPIEAPPENLHPPTIVTLTQSAPGHAQPQPPPPYKGMYPAVPNAPSEDDIEYICIAAAVNSQSQQLQESSSTPDSDIEYPPPPPSTIKLTVQTGVKLKRGKVLKPYVHKQGDDDVEMPELEGADLTAPFMTVGNQLIMKPINPGVLKDIIQGAPNPRTNPSACLMYLKRMCLGQIMTQIDIKLIINGILWYDSDSGWDWSRVPSISETDNGTGVGEAGSDSVYELSTSAGCAEMWDKVEAEMLRLWKNKQSISTALACKQGAKEEIGIFVKRFYKPEIEDGMEHIEPVEGVVKEGQGIGDREIRLIGAGVTKEE
ncbi:Hypothetical predicted protein [Pelobates cultripes]|uniref:Uncharacterized protein n=1 Tax=Pelobates cultripes TaxID=61616 RepID=A0AAD1W9A2_PELCU|nr:Hypothetical predicted protein [Pelobates cultripes]